MSRIDRDVLHELWLEGQNSGRPLTEIVADAVVTHLNQRFLNSTQVAESSTPFPQESPRPAA